MIENRDVLARGDGGSIGIVSLIALVVAAGLIALIVWEPWSGNVTLRSTTSTARTGALTSGTR